MFWIIKFVRFFGILFFCTVSFAFCDTFDELVFRSPKNVFLGEENEFSLFVSDFSPERVSLDNAAFDSLPSGAHVVSVHFGEDVKEKSIRGTKIAVTILFDSADDFAFPAIPLSVDGRRVFAHFEPFSVFENPKEAKPILFFDFLEGGKAFERVRLRVFSRFALSVVSLSYDLPEDAIVSEVLPFKPFDVSKSDFSASPTLLCELDWMPLSKGNHALPNFFADVISFSGKKERIVLSGKTIFVESANEVSDFQSQKNENAEIERVFFDAFDETKIETAKTEDFLEKARAICEARKKEREEIPFFGKSRAKRRAIEEECGIFHQKNEPNTILFAFFLIFGALFLLLFVFLLFLKNRAAFFVLFLTFLFFFFGAKEFFLLKKSVAIFASDALFFVPEETQPLRPIPIKCAERVYVENKIGDYLFISGKNGAGWTKKESVFFIK